MSKRYYYFGQDDQGFYADDEAGNREYMESRLWHQIMDAYKDVTLADAVPGDAFSETVRAEKIDDPTQRVKIAITERIRVDVYERGVHIKTVHLTPDTTEF